MGTKIQHRECAKILSAFEHKSGAKKRKRGAGMDFCGLRVLVDLKCTEDTPAWWRPGLDKYMGKYVCLQREDSMLEGKVTRYVDMSCLLLPERPMCQQYLRFKATLQSSTSPSDKWTMG